MASKAILKMRAANKALAKTLKADRMSDFKVTQDRMDAVLSNLNTNYASISKLQNRSNARTIRAMKRLEQRTDRRNARDIAAAEKTATSLYGSAVGQSVQSNLHGADAKAIASRDATKGGLIGGKMLSHGARQAQDLLATGAAEARGAADYALAQALAYRAKNDAELVAQQQLELQKMRLQAQLDWKNRRRELDYLREEEEKTGKRGLVAVATTAADASAWFRNYLVREPGASIAEMKQAYIAEYGITEADAGQLPLISKIAVSVHNSVKPNGSTVRDYSRQDEVADVMNAIGLLYPDFDGAAKRMRAAIKAELAAGYSQRGVDDLEKEVETGEPRPVGEVGTQDSSETNPDDPSTWGVRSVATDVAAAQHNPPLRPIPGETSLYQDANGQMYRVVMVKDRATFVAL